MTLRNIPKSFGRRLDRNPTAARSTWWEMELNKYIKHITHRMDNIRKHVEHLYDR